MNNPIRCFIALELTSGIQQKLAAILKILKENISEGVKWVPPENIDLTLKFLGDVQVEDIDPVKRGLEQAVGGIHPIRVSLTGLGAFPGMAKPRVVWVGLEADPVTGLLVNNIDQVIGKIGYPGDNKPLTPHLTLGRTSKSINSRQMVLLSNFLKSNPFQIDMQDTLRNVTLFRSSLTPSGAVYNRLYSITLHDEIKSTC